MRRQVGIVWWREERWVALACLCCSGSGGTVVSSTLQSTNQWSLCGTYSTNFGDQVLLVWDHGKFTATIPLTNANNNVGFLRSAPGQQIFSSFLDLGLNDSQTHFPCPVVTDNEADALDSDKEDDATLFSTASLEGDDEDVINTTSTPSAPNTPHMDEPANTATDDQPNVIPFDLDHDDHPTNLASQDNSISSLDDCSELLQWHYQLGNLPFANLRLMAARGEIPKRLANCRIPKCKSCLYGRATKRPWRTKGQTSKIETVATPWECVSVDQLESPVAGFVGQNKGYLFHKWYKVATIFVDHFSLLSFVYLQESTKGEETLLAKRAFEMYAASFGWSNHFQLSCWQWEICRTPVPGPCRKGIVLFRQYIDN